MSPDLKVPSHWILIRGLARESRHWGDFDQKLSHALSTLGTNARVDALDLPGSGAFSEMKSPTSITGITEFVREKFLEIRQRQRERGETPAPRIYLVAISLGGMVACRWMERWPEDFAGCVLINTSFSGYSPLYRRLAPSSLLHFADVVRNAADARKRESSVLKLVSNRPEIRDTTADEWARLHLERPVSYENFARQLFAAARFTARLRHPPSPTLVLNSLGDRMVDPSCSAEIAARWNAELRRHPSGGHDLTLDEPDWVVGEIAKWYERIKGPR